MLSLPPEKEKLILKQVSQGSEEAYAQLFHAYKDKLFAFIRRITTSDEKAEDLMQDIFLKIWLQRENLLDVENFNAFLFRSAQNHAINLIRRMAKETLILKEKQKQQDHSSALSPNELLYYKNFREFLNKAIDTLPPQQKTIYRLSREENLKQKEIAEQLGLSLSTVQNHLSRALHTLREKLKERMGE